MFWNIERMLPIVSAIAPNTFPDLRFSHPLNAYLSKSARNFQPFPVWFSSLLMLFTWSITCDTADMA